jgi:hypothetical protein
MRALVIRNRLSIIAEKALTGKYLGLFSGSNDSITKKSLSSKTFNPTHRGYRFVLGRFLMEALFAFYDLQIQFFPFIKIDRM